MTRADRLLIAALAIAALFAWPLAASAAGRDADSVVIVGPTGTSVLPLDTDTTVAVEGYLGTVRVCVASGSARVVDSCCPSRVCVRTGAVSAPGSAVACVPNGVTVTVGRSGDVEFDARIR